MTDSAETEPNTDSGEPIVRNDAESGLFGAIGRLARVIEDTRPGRSPIGAAERAALRRIDIDRMHPSHWTALLRTLLAAGLDPTAWSPPTLRRWALIAQGMAVCSHDGTERLGRQFAAARVAESRVMRLLSAKGDAFEQYVPRIARLMGAQGHGIDWRELGALIMAEMSGQDARGDELRLRVAGNYYAALPRPDAA